MLSATDKHFDIILWGATGFTGKLVAEYLATNFGVGKELRWAIAGRNSKKLESVRQELTQITHRAASLPLLVGDSHDLDSLKAIAREAKVICSTVGPYFEYGVLLVQACIEEGADYCDLTGETPFIRRIIDSYEDQAIAAKRKIVHCCGFDSIPSDMGCWMIQEHAINHVGVPCEDVAFYAGKTKGGLSGGTVASMVGMIEQSVSDKSIRRILGNPYALNPKGTWRGTDGSDQQSVVWDSDLSCWTGPFIMAGINTRVVRRTNALLDRKYGDGFRYREVMTFPKGMKGRTRAETMRLGLGAFVAMVALGPTRSLLKKTLLPAPGEGPSREEREAGYFNISLIGKGTKSNGERFEVRGHVYGDKDPGYAGTARMLAEAAVCLALEHERLPDTFGILTPASAMGNPLLNRLRDSGMEFRIEQSS